MIIQCDQKWVFDAKFSSGECVSLQSEQNAFLGQTSLGWLVGKSTETREIHVKNAQMKRCCQVQSKYEKKSRLIFMLYRFVILFTEEECYHCLANLVAAKEKTFITQTKLLYEVTWKTVMQIAKKHAVSVWKNVSLQRADDVHGICSFMILRIICVFCWYLRNPLLRICNVCAPTKSSSPSSSIGAGGCWAAYHFRI